MKFSTFSSVKVSAVIFSMVVNVALFVALDAGFGGVAEPELTVVQLPTVTVYGKRLVSESTPVALAKTTVATTPVHDIKL